MALVRRPAAPAMGAVLFAAGLVGCCGPGSEQARDENRKMDALIRSGKELEREQAARPVLVARSQVPVQELEPVRLGAPTRVDPPPVPVAPPRPAADPTVPADGIRAP